LRRYGEEGDPGRVASDTDAAFWSIAVTRGPRLNIERTAYTCFGGLIVETDGHQRYHLEDARAVAIGGESGHGEPFSIFHLIHQLLTKLRIVEKTTYNSGTIGRVVSLIIIRTISDFSALKQSASLSALLPYARWVPIDGEGFH
jgi:hypothetical protein